MNHVTEDLIENGFAKATGILDAEDIRQLRAASDKMLGRKMIPYAEYQNAKHKSEWDVSTYTNTNWTVVVGVPGQSPELDRIFEKVLSHPTIKGTLEAILGPGYKMWQANIRRAEPHGLGQALHQDAVGELGLSLLINDTFDNDGATAFLPGSHRWPVRYGDLGFALWPNRMAPLLGAATGAAGDLAFFFNRTWHGRFAGVHPGTAILMSFFPVGATYPIQKMPEAVLAKLGPETRRLLDPNEGVTIQPDGRALVGAPGAPLPSRRPETEDVLRGHVPMPPRSPFLFVKGWARMKNAVRSVVRRYRPAPALSTSPSGVTSRRVRSRKNAGKVAGAKRRFAR